MTRLVSVEFAEDVLTRLRGEEPVEIEAADADGERWMLRMQRDADREVVVLSLEALAPWSVRLEGFAVGSAHSADPAEAAREALRQADITSLPQGVLVTAEREGEAWAVFTLNNQAYCIPKKQFAAEVEPSGQWTNARAKQNKAIAALRDELKKLGR